MRFDRVFVTNILSAMCLVVLCFSSNAQQRVDWVKKYCGLHHQHISKVVVDYEDNVLVLTKTLGASDSTLIDGNTLADSSKFTSTSTTFKIIKLTPLGDIIWTKNVTPKRAYVDISGLDVFSNGDILIAGTVVSNGVTSFDPNSINPADNFSAETRDIFLNRLDKNGDYIWHRVFYNLNDSDNVQDIVINSNDQIYITGETQKGTLRNDSSAPTVRVPFVAQFSPSGIINWQHFNKYLRGGMAPRIEKFVTINNSLYVMGVFNGVSILNYDNLTREGDTIISNNYTIGNYGNVYHDNNTFMYKIDPAGNTVWAKAYGNKGNFVSKDAKANQNDEIVINAAYSPSLVLGSDTFYYDTINLSNTFRNESMLIKFDTNGNYLNYVNNSKIVSSVSNYFHLEIDDKGNLYTIQTFYQRVLDRSTGIFYDPNGGRHVLFQKRDPDGNILLSSHMKAINFALVMDITLNQNNDLYVVGDFNNQLDIDYSNVTSNILSYHSSSGFLVKYANSPLVQKEYSKSINSIVVFPNPVSNRLTITHKETYIDRIYLYDIKGVLMQEIIPDNQNNTQLDLSTLRKGTYIIKIKSSDTILVKKIIRN